MSRFVRPEITRLTISKGDYIDVKKRLNAGEQREMFARMSSHMVPGEPLKLDAKHVGITKVLEYLVGWSFMDEGRPVPYTYDMPIEARRAALDLLEPQSFSEVLQAIEAHEDAVAAARDAEKNSQGGGSESSATSPSLVTTAGATNG